ncbi:hypothetical protein HUS73_23120 [Pandoraea nosoerga]|nr:hypothetical protein [Pandoraea nosoerga]
MQALPSTAATYLELTSTPAKNDENRLRSHALSCTRREAHGALFVGIQITLRGFVYNDSKLDDVAVVARMLKMI